jgi:hypothetical protein
MNATVGSRLNRARPHSALGYRTPEELVHRQQASTALFGNCVLAGSHRSFTPCNRTQCAPRLRVCIPDSARPMAARHSAAGADECTDQGVNETLERGTLGLEEGRYKERMVLQTNDPDLTSIVRAFDLNIISILKQWRELGV